MIPMGRALAALAVAGLGLAGCSSSKITEAQNKQYLQIAMGMFHHKAAPLPHLTRAQITAMKQPLYRADLPKRKARAYLLLIGQNDGVNTWTTTDGIMISLRDGVVVRTLGLGQDLMSARMPTAAELRRGKGAVTATYYYLTGDDQSFGVPVKCELSRLGREKIEIASLTYRTEHVRETCAGDSERFTNEYWIEPNGHIRKSKQWIGPDVGYLELQDLRK